jgi:hypothetical protein
MSERLLALFKVAGGQGFTVAINPDSVERIYAAPKADTVTILLLTRKRCGG